MQPIPAKCPLCGGELVVTAMQCRVCDTRFEGRFAPRVTPFADLTPEQRAFVELFIRCEGKLNCVGEELNLSYPTVRNRLREIIRALGYEPKGEAEAEAEEAEASAPDEAQRRKVLDDLEAGRITVEEALRLLKGGA